MIVSLQIADHLVARTRARLDCDVKDQVLILPETTTKKKSSLSRVVDVRYRFGGAAVL
jgi:hypothetical protein